MSHSHDFPYMPEMLLDDFNQEQCATHDPEVFLLPRHVDTEMKLEDSSAPKTFLQFMMRESSLSKRLKLGTVCVYVVWVCVYVCVCVCCIFNNILYISYVGRLTNGDTAFYANRKRRNLGTLDPTRAKYIKINREGCAPYLSSEAVSLARDTFRR